MKKLFVLFLLFPVLTRAQCPQWIGKPYKNTKAFMGLIQQRLSFKFSDSSISVNRDNMVFNDSAALYIGKVSANNDSVESIYLEAPTDDIVKLAAWFEKEYLRCAIKKVMQTIYFPDCIVETKPLTKTKSAFYVTAK